MIKAKIGEPEDDTVGVIPMWDLESIGSKHGNTMVFNGKTYHWCSKHHGRVMWVCYKPDNFNKN